MAPTFPTFEEWVSGMVTRDDPHVRFVDGDYTEDSHACLYELYVRRCMKKHSAMIGKNDYDEYDMSGYVDHGQDSDVVGAVELYRFPGRIRHLCGISDDEKASLLEFATYPFDPLRENSPMPYPMDALLRIDDIVKRAFEQSWNQQQVSGCMQIK
jgi:hypothetical protein